MTNDTTPPADPPDVAEVRERSLRCSSYSLFQDRDIMLFRYDEAVRERVVVAREARESLAHQAARIRELEAEAVRLRVERVEDLARMQSAYETTLTEVRKERNAWFRVSNTARAAGYHEALDAVAEQEAKIIRPWQQWHSIQERLRARYPRPESIAEREVAAQMDAMHPEDIEYDVTLPRIPTGPTAERRVKDEPWRIPGIPRIPRRRSDWARERKEGVTP